MSPRILVNTLTRKRQGWWWFWLFIGLTACANEAQITTAVPPTQPPTAITTPTPSPTPTPTLTASPTGTATATATPSPLPTLETNEALTQLIEAQENTAVCGLLLPITNPPVTPLAPTFDPAAVARFDQIVPNNARAAWERIQSHPQDVGLVAIRLGGEGSTAVLNGDVPMPLASVVKLLHLIAYSEAVAAGELNPLQSVSLAELDNYFLPRSDGRSHSNAIDVLREEGRVRPDETITLEAVAEIMMRFSSNAATDYMHFLLGQERIEQTAISLGLTTQTAPCPWLAQFLAIDNHTRPGGSATAVENYIADPDLYARESMALAEAYRLDDDFRAAQRQSQWRPPIEVQSRFSENLNGQATPNEYATIMLRLAQNELSNPESSYFARRLLEWPMRFGENQEIYYNLAYKDGNLPGILTTAYYAYPQNASGPVVLILFYRNIPQQTYRQWRQNIPHDEFARWLLRDPQAIPALGAALGGE